MGLDVRAYRAREGISRRAKALTGGGDAALRHKRPQPLVVARVASVLRVSVPGCEGMARFSRRGKHTFSMTVLDGHRRVTSFECSRSTCTSLFDFL